MWVDDRLRAARVAAAGPERLLAVGGGAGDMSIKAKDRGLICRMAGNIAGPLASLSIADQAKGNLPLPDDFFETLAIMSVRLSAAIVGEADRVLAGEGDEQE